MILTPPLFTCADHPWSSGWWQNANSSIQQLHNTVDSFVPSFMAIMLICFLLRTEKTLQARQKWSYFTGKTRVAKHGHYLEKSLDRREPKSNSIVVTAVESLVVTTSSLYPTALFSSLRDPQAIVDEANCQTTT